MQEACLSLALTWYLENTRTVDETDPYGYNFALLTSPYQGDVLAEKSMAEGKPTKPETLAMRQSAAQQLTASQASMSLSAAGSVEAEHVDSKMSALGQVYADSLSAELSLVGLANGIQAVLRDGAAVAVVSDAAVIDHATVGVLVAREVHGTSIRTGILMAGRVDGDVDAVLDTTGAIAAGLAAGLGLGLIWSIARMFRRR